MSARKLGAKQLNKFFTSRRWSWWQRPKMDLRVEGKTNHTTINKKWFWQQEGWTGSGGRGGVAMAVAAKWIRTTMAATNDQSYTEIWKQLEGGEVIFRNFMVKKIWFCWVLFSCDSAYHTPLVCLTFVCLQIGGVIKNLIDFLKNTRKLGNIKKSKNIRSMWFLILLVNSFHKLSSTR